MTNFTLSNEACVYKLWFAKMIKRESLVKLWVVGCGYWANYGQFWKPNMLICDIAIIISNMIYGQTLLTQFYLHKAFLGNISGNNCKTFNINNNPTKIDFEY